MPEFRGAPHRRYPNFSKNRGPLHAGYLRSKILVVIARRVFLILFSSRNVAEPYEFQCWPGDRVIAGYLDE